jgi:glycosyltransferase involved in cell wall biosynthesis
MKKIVHIISGLQVGGAERSLFNICNSSLNDSFKQYVICLGNRGYYSQKIEEIGLEIYHINFSSWHFFKSLIKFIAVLKKISPNIIQGWMNHGNFASILALLILNFKPIIYWNIRQSFYKNKNDLFYTKFLFLFNIVFSRIPKKIIINSNISKIQLQNFGFHVDSFKFIPNGFDSNYWVRDLSFRKLKRENLGIKNLDFVIGYVGRYHSMKNIILLLKAFEIISINLPNTKLVIIGQKENDFNKFEKQIFDRIPKNQIILLNQMYDVNKYYSLFDLFILCSVSEGFPNVLGEAMSCELCCISTNVGEASALLQDVGLIIPVDDLDALVREITNCIENLEITKNMGGGARNKIIKSYSLQNTVNQYFNLYNGKVLEN